MVRGLKAAPASAFDLLEALDDMGGRARFTRLRFGQMARQVSQGASVTFRTPEGALVAVVGLWPEPDHLEAWLAVGPAFRGRFRSALEAIEDALCFFACREAPVDVRIYVRVDPKSRDQGQLDRVAGARMARWLGFDRTGTEALPSGPVEVFQRHFGGAPGGQ